MRESGRRQKGRCSRMGTCIREDSKARKMWIISGHDRNVGGGVGWDGAARDEVSWLEQFHCGGYCM